MRLLGVLLLAASAAAFDAARCTEYASQGYCSQPKTAKYMQRHCSSYCYVESQESAAPEEGEEDPSCEQWKQSGYCEHEQYTEYMQRSCPKACGVADLGAAATYDFEMAEQLDEDAAVGAAAAGGGYESEFDETGTDIIDDVPASPPPEPEPPAADGPDNDNCVGWAQQGLCDSEDYAQYMAQNCKQTCADPSAAVAAAAGSASATEPTPANCLMWAKRGMCGEDSEYRQYMEMNCAETCAKLEDILKAELPPSAFVPILLTVGFFALVGWAGREALQRDAARNSQLGKSWQKVGTQIGEEATIGPGKPNKFKSTKKEKKK